MGFIVSTRYNRNNRVDRPEEERGKVSTAVMATLGNIHLQLFTCRVDEFCALASRMEY